jgi:hypothetical protein
MGAGLRSRHASDAILLLRAVERARLGRAATRC